MAFESSTSISLFSELPAFLPDLIDGETLFTWTARYHRLSGGVLASESSRRLFGDAQAGLRHDFPANLGRFSEITGGRLGIAEQLANKHTLLAYFGSFLNIERYRSVLEQMQGPCVSKLKTTLGIMPSCLGAAHPLKACEMCMSEEMRTLGISLWHLEHQFPSVWICRKHDWPLQSFQATELKCLRRFILPENVTEQEWCRPVSEYDCNRAHLRRIAEFSVILCAQLPCTFRPEVVRYAILEAAMHRNLISSDGSLYFRDLRIAFADHYRGLGDLLGGNLLEGLSKEHGGLLGTVLRRYPGIRHPIKQILVIAFFFESAGDFLLAYVAAEKSIAEGNASVFGVPLSVGWRKELRHQIEDAKVSVSQAARNLGIPFPQAIRCAKQDRIQYAKRSRVLTPNLEAQLRDLICQGLERPKIVALTGIKRSFLRAYLAKDPILRVQWHMKRLELIRDQHRGEFITFRNANPGLSISSLRSAPDSGYGWLFRNDRAWLLERSGRKS